MNAKKQNEIMSQAWKNMAERENVNKVSKDTILEARILDRPVKKVYSQSYLKGLKTKALNKANELRPENIMPVVKKLKATKPKKTKANKTKTKTTPKQAKTKVFDEIGQLAYICHNLTLDIEDVDDEIRRILASPSISGIIHLGKFPKLGYRPVSSKPKYTYPTYNGEKVSYLPLDKKVDKRTSDKVASDLKITTKTNAERLILKKAKTDKASLYFSMMEGKVDYNGLNHSYFVSRKLPLANKGLMAYEPCVYQFTNGLKLLDDFRTFAPKKFEVYDSSQHTETIGSFAFHKAQRVKGDMSIKSITVTGEDDSGRKTSEKVDIRLGEIAETEYFNTLARRVNKGLRTGLLSGDFEVTDFPSQYDEVLAELVTKSMIDYIYTG